MISLPVAFISTTSRDGVRNIAPYSCVMPVLRPFDLICVASAKMRDTVVNIENTEEFVINMPGAEMVDKVIPTALHVPFEVNEFEMADLKEIPSKKSTRQELKAAMPGWNVNCIKSMKMSMEASLIY